MNVYHLKTVSGKDYSIFFSTKLWRLDDGVIGNSFGLYIIFIRPCHEAK